MKTISKSFDTVYVVQELKGRDFTSLLGCTDNITYVVDEDCPMTKEAENHVNKVGARLNKFNSGTDALVLSGDPVNIGLAMSAVLRKEGKITVLKWNRHSNNYVPIKISL